MKKNIHLILLYFLSQSVYCQTHPLGNWISYHGNQSISSRWNIQNEIQLRNYNLIGDVSQFLVRMGIGYSSLNQRNNWLLGYAHFDTYIYEGESNEKINIKENRLFQQFLRRWSSKRFVFTNRNRLEERFFKNDLAFRWRSQFSVIVPMNQKQLLKGTCDGTSSNEIFITNHNNVFDRNRFYVGIGYAYRDFIRFETGYMIQSMPHNYQQQLQLIVINNFPFLHHPKKRTS